MHRLAPRPRLQLNQLPLLDFAKQQGHQFGQHRVDVDEPPPFKNKPSRFFPENGDPYRQDYERSALAPICLKERYGHGSKSRKQFHDESARPH